MTRNVSVQQLDPVHKCRMLNYSFVNVQIVLLNTLGLMEIYSEFLKLKNDSC